MGHISYKTIGVVLKQNTTLPQSITQLLSSIAAHGVAIVFFEHSPFAQYATFTAVSEVDVLLVLGGDGTIIKVVRELADSTTPILSINLGTVGFMADMSIAEAIEALPSILHGNATADIRSLLDITITQTGSTVFTGRCFNEVVLAKGKIARLIEIEASVDGAFLTDYNADGLLISTPTGSTAYNLSAGGPIVHPGLNAMIITAINPYSLSQKPIVVPATSTICLKPLLPKHKHEDEAVYLTLDGQVFTAIEPNMIITISAAQQTVTFLRKAEDSFFHTLRTKLKWGDKPVVNQLSQD
jgi:NAD+ kinase